MPTTSTTTASTNPLVARPKPPKPWLTKFSGGSGDSSGTSVKAAPVGPPPLVPVGSIKAANHWKGLFQGAIWKDDVPTDLRAWIQSGIDTGAWRMLRDSDGAGFRSFDAFCRARRPFGLSREPEQVRAFLCGLLGERGAALASVAPAMQGVPRDEAEGSRHRGGISERKEQRLRAVQERAPEVVRQLYTKGLLELDQAASFGRQTPTQVQKVATTAFVAATQLILEALGESPTSAELEKVRKRVIELLPARPEPKPAERLAKQFERLSTDEQQRFLDRVGLVRRAMAVAAE